ncbi:MAG TPA: TonB-dependent receptor, partial [Saprospiraceae bacterium]|nr:TonB-dependent receptor [Saprospiraceae bacterium]
TDKTDQDMKWYFSLLFLLLATAGMAQLPDLHGVVANEDDEVLAGATIWWQGTTNAVNTGEDGSFQISRPDTTAIIMIQYVGYEAASLEILPEDQDVYITLTGVAILQEVEVTGDEKGNYISTLGTRYVETISSNELKKAACCNLAESFETNASVDIGMTNAVTGASEVQMLGLRGIYTQLLVENRTAFNGLAQPFALEYIPGTWVESIQISKGASSVANGPQCITGQINTELVKPTTDRPFFINLFGNTLGRMEGNLHLNKVWKPTLSTGLLVHASGQQQEWDRNEDRFLDMPRKKQINTMYRMFYSMGNLEGQFNLHGIMHRQEGGQLSSLENPWRITQNNDRLEGFGKNGIVFNTERYQSLGLIYNAYVHQYDGQYGVRDHTGLQRGAYLNLLYNVEGKTPEHSFAAGASHQVDDIQEDLFGVSFDRKDQISGVFTQYSYGKDMPDCEAPFSLSNNGGIIVGVRADYHQRFGWFITPRVNARLNLDAQTVIRVSAGRGWRSPNFPPDWQSMLFNNWKLQVSERLLPEDAWVFGANLTKSFLMGTRIWSVVLDAFHTRFTNQVVMDMESTHTVIQLYNLDGRSYSNSLLALVNMEFMDGLSGKVAWKYNEVKTTYQGQVASLPMVPLHRVLVSADYATPNEQWRFNLTAQGIGSMRLPTHDGFPPELVVNSPQNSPEYMLLSGQVNWVRGNLDIYLGGENLGNVTQPFPIIDWQNPGSEHFDASRVYAPVIGTRVYMGIRYSL